MWLGQIDSVTMDVLVVQSAINIIKKQGMNS